MLGRMLVGHVARRAHAGGACRSASPFLFRLGGTVGDGRSRGARACAARGLACCTRFCALRLRHRACGECRVLERARLDARLCRRHPRLYRSADHARGPRRAARSCRKISDTLLPSSTDQRLATVAFWAPLLLPAAGALAANLRIVSLWAMPAMTLLPVVLLSSPLIVISRAALVRLLALAVALPVVATLAAPAVAIAILRLGEHQQHQDLSSACRRDRAAWRASSDHRWTDRRGGRHGHPIDPVYFTSQPSTVDVIRPDRSPSAEQVPRARSRAGVSGVSGMVRPSNRSTRRAQARRAAHRSRSRSSTFGVIRKARALCRRHPTPAACERSISPRMSPSLMQARIMRRGPDERSDASERLRDERPACRLRSCGLRCCRSPRMRKRYPEADGVAATDDRGAALCRGMQPNAPRPRTQEYVRASRSARS